MNNKFHGFTLIELLIVIAIIGILSAMIFPNYMAARERARDGQRKSDLNQVQKALEMYQQDNNSSFPETNGDIPWGNIWQNAAGTVTYMSKVPQDPLNSNDTSGYVYTLIDSQSYTLCACLENKADSDNNTIICSAGSCSGACGTRSAGKCYYIEYQ